MKKKREREKEKTNQSYRQANRSCSRVTIMRYHGFPSSFLSSLSLSLFFFFLFHRVLQNLRSGSISAHADTNIRIRGVRVSASLAESQFEFPLHSAERAGKSPGSPFSPRALGRNLSRVTCPLWYVLESREERANSRAMNVWCTTYPLINERSQLDLRFRTDSYSAWLFDSASATVSTLANLQRFSLYGKFIV